MLNRVLRWHRRQKQKLSTRNRLFSTETIIISALIRGTQADSGQVEHIPHPSPVRLAEVWLEPRRRSTHLDCGGTRGGGGSDSIDTVLPQQQSTPRFRSRLRRAAATITTPPPRPLQLRERNLANAEMTDRDLTCSQLRRKLPETASK